ncbi:MAG: type II toxin-antitoxin system RelE/ParE family toxin [bacterium]
MCPLFPHDRRVARFQAFERQARRKLLYLHRARTVQDLRQPPGNELESLEGDRRGQYSIRINTRHAAAGCLLWRICFRWESGDAYDVEIVDYH